MSGTWPLRRSRRRVLSVAILALAAGLGGCNGGSASLASSPTTSTPSSPSGTPITSSTVPASAAPTSAATLPLPASPVTGVVTGVVASGLADVSGMTLRLDDGSSFEFRIGSLENGAEFPPGHLKEHMATSSPVKVWFRVEGTELVAYRIEDAG